MQDQAKPEPAQQHATRPSAYQVTASAGLHTSMTEEAAAIATARQRSRASSSVASVLSQGQQNVASKVCYFLDLPEAVQLQVIDRLPKVTRAMCKAVCTHFNLIISSSEPHRVVRRCAQLWREGSNRSFQRKTVVINAAHSLVMQAQQQVEWGPEIHQSIHSFLTELLNFVEYLNASKTWLVDKDTLYQDSYWLDLIPFGRIAWFTMPSGGWQWCWPLMQGILVGHSSLSDRLNMRLIHNGFPQLRMLSCQMHDSFPVPNVSLLADLPADVTLLSHIAALTAHCTVIPYISEHIMAVNELTKIRNGFVSLKASFTML